MTQAIGFTIDKAPKGGYKLCRIKGDHNGGFTLDVVAYCTTLIEAQEIEHAEKTEMFGERAWYPRHMPPQQTYREQASAVFPPSAPPAASPELDESLPKFAQDYAASGGMMGELYNRTNGILRALMPALFLGALWLSQIRVA
jgi:hypothetical protein